MSGYTPAQRAAINELTHPLQLIACAGSGKTHVISQRISRILAQPGVKPGNIIAFTFTEKAAAHAAGQLGAVGRRRSSTCREMAPIRGLVARAIGGLACGSRPSSS
ncbi:UvrD-helicase domain-containing protein [Agromyces sp. NPDC056523]|uniref:UvrD-helicase domain-containing protein n=1 Tax=Agromyces sp. NPDC056523 TaxID=3345850 RepID=UPI00366E8293